MNTKENYMQKIDAQIKEVDARIDMLNARIQAMDADMKSSYQDEYDRLFSEKEELKNELIFLQESDESTWDKAKDQFDDKWEKFKDNVEGLYNRI